MIEFQVFNVAMDSMNREHQRMRQAANRIATSNLQSDSSTGNFSEALQSTPGTEKETANSTNATSQPTNTIDEMTTIMAASRLYEANVSVISSARSAFEKALEISGRR